LSKKLNITILFLIIFVASVALRIFVTKKIATALIEDTPNYLQKQKITIIHYKTHNCLVVSVFFCNFAAIYERTKQITEYEKQNLISSANRMCGLLPKGETSH
jgi:hypothetical protein